MYYCTHRMYFSWSECEYGCIFPGRNVNMDVRHNLMNFVCNFYIYLMYVFYTLQFVFQNYTMWVTIFGMHKHVAL
jgi:hypothetical protein